MPNDRTIALDVTASENERRAAIERLAASHTRQDAETLIEIANRFDEIEAISRAAGEAFYTHLLRDDGVVTQFDTRDFSPAASDGFLLE